MRRKSSVSRQCSVNSAGASSASRERSAPSVSTWSMSRARPRASPEASAGVCLTAGRTKSRSSPVAVLANRASFHRITRLVSARCRSMGSMAGGTSSAPAGPAPSSPRPRSRLSSSSMPPMGRMRGSSMARLALTSRNASSIALQARRVGSSSVMRGRSIGAGGDPPPAGISPTKMALARHGRKGVPAGTVSTRGVTAIRNTARRWPTPVRPP